jgi:hypothetical protein
METPLCANASHPKFESLRDTRELLSELEALSLEIIENELPLELALHGDRPPEVLDGELNAGCLRIQRPAASGGASTQDCDPFTLINHECEIT